MSNRKEIIDFSVTSVEQYATQICNDCGHPEAATLVSNFLKLCIAIRSEQTIVDFKSTIADLERRIDVKSSESMKIRRIAVKAVDCALKWMPEGVEQREMIAFRKELTQ